MTTYLTATQAAQRLGKSEKTIRRWIDEKRLTAFHPRKNRLAIAEQDVERLALELAEYEQPAPALEQDVSALVERIETLAARLIALEKQVAAQEQQITALLAQPGAPSMASHTRAPRAAAPATSTASSADLPGGSVHMRDFATDHGVNVATFRDHITNGHVPALSIPKPNRPKEVERWLTPDQQQQAVDYWRANGKPFTPNSERYPALNYGDSEQS